MQAVTITQITPPEFRQIIKDEFRDYLNSLSSQVKSAPDPEQLLTRKELAKFLGISEVSVWARVKDGSIESYKIGNLVRFKMSSVLANLHKIERKKK